MKGIKKRFTIMSTLYNYFLVLGCFFVYTTTIAQSKYPVCGPQAQFFSKDSINITTFGASTVFGTPAPLNFQNSLKAYLLNCYKGKAVTVNNYGIAGETTEQGVARFDAAIADKNGFVLILMGTNDAIKITDHQMRLDVTINNMRTMIQKAKAKNLAVILGTIQYFVETQGTRTQRALAIRQNKVVDLINNAYRSMVTEYGIRLAEINYTMGKNASLYSDFVHPNSRGYEVISLVWFDAIGQEIAANFQIIAVIQNYPNPADTYTKLVYTLSSAARVIITLNNFNGQRIAVLFDDYRNAGYQEETVSTAQYPPGIYILGYELLNLRFYKKMIIAH